MTLLQLQYFQTLARTLHYTRTAEQLCISQPSLSYAIGELEKELSVPLFAKENRKVVLTLYGQQLLPYVDQALLFLEEGKNRVKKISSNEPKVVKLGYFQSISASTIPTVINGFYKDNPESDISFQFTESLSSDIMNHVKNGSVDFGFTFHSADWATSVPVSKQFIYLAVSADHPLVAQKSVSFHDFCDEPLVMLGETNSLRADINKILYEYGIVPKIVAEVRECNAALQYVGLGLGATILPFVPSMNSDKLKFLPIIHQGEHLSRTIYFTFHKTRPISLATQEVRDYIIAHFALGK